MPKMKGNILRYLYYNREDKLSADTCKIQYSDEEEASLIICGEAVLSPFALSTVRSTASFRLNLTVSEYIQHVNDSS
jgi:hypothetical protein